MARVVRDAGCPWILMHWRGHSADDGRARATTTTWSPTSAAELLSRVDEALAAGVDAGQLVLDPGLGLRQDAEHNWALLAHLEAFTGIGLPVLVGSSRKSFLGSLLAGAGRHRPARPPDARPPPPRSPCSPR